MVLTEPAGPVPSLPPGWSVTCEDLIYVSGVTWGMVSFMKFQSHLDMSSKPWLAKLGQWARLCRDFVITSPAHWFVGFSLCQWICAQQRFHLINWFERAVFVPLLFRRLTSLSVPSLAAEDVLLVYILKFSLTKEKQLHRRSKSLSMNWIWLITGLWKRFRNTKPQTKREKMDNITS